MANKTKGFDCHFAASDNHHAIAECTTNVVARRRSAWIHDQRRQSDLLSRQNNNACGFDPVCMPDYLFPFQADLVKHLINEQENLENRHKAVEKQASARPTSPDTTDQRPAPLVFASDNDFQFLQAMNHLKGLPVQTAQVAVDPKSVPPKTKKN